jgi:hypothetical protein
MGHPYWWKGEILGSHEHTLGSTICQVEFLARSLRRGSRTYPTVIVSAQGLL